MTNKSLKLLGLTAIISIAGCNLDKTNPNAPTQDAIFADRQGIVSLSIGLQARYGSGMSSFIFPGGLISDEMGTPAGALQSYKDAEIGSLADTYDAVELPWRSHYQTIKTANDLISNAGKVALGDETLSGILSLSYLLKAASLSDLIQQYQQVIINPEAATTTFAARGPALTYILGLLDTAQVQANRFGARTEFDGSIVAKGFSLKNTILAMQARNQRIAKNWPAALSAANAVDTSVISVIPFSAQATNPVFDVSITNVRPRDTLRFAAETGDARVPFHISGATVQGTIRPIRTFTQYAVNTNPIAVYWPGEIMLIRAEAYANTGQLVLAAQMVNYVRTRCGGAANQPKACLQPVVLTTQDQIIAEIYKQRKFELFATGLRWEDVRRQGLVSATSAFAKRCWLLYPNSERNTSATVPQNPVDPPSAFSSCGV
ncbi:MAG: RagB/SusD family nutrient uptake outer membrane protein [Gemmatimonadaceae bacterium]|nr:RagB/SusD family nutrient uptake outer membrane protein [Gemmatimonadaceae bacterium]